MTVAEELRFSRICHEELSREKVRDGIGLLEEKRLHSILKRWICDDFNTHEQKVPGRGEKSRKFVADVLTPNGEIFEIQTAALYPMRKKIEFYLTETDHNITVVHPLIGKKEILWIHPKTAEITKSRSPLREGVLHGVAQLKAYIPYLCNGRFHLVFPVMEAEEYRLLDGWGKGGKRGSHRYELLPRALVEVYRLSTREDFAAHFPKMPAEFTAKEFGKSTRLGGYALYDVLAVFEGLGIIEKCGTRARATLWRKVEE